MADQAIYSPMRVLDGNGDPVPGALVTFYASGTLTLIDVWVDAGGTIPATNPVEADGDGNLPQRFVGQQAKAVITDALGATIRTIDPVPIMPSSFGAAGTTSFSPSASLPVSNVQAAIDMVDDKVADLGESYIRFDAPQVLSGPETTQVWENLYLGSLAGKEKISVPGDIDASGTASWWTVLFGDGSWKGLLGWNQDWGAPSRTAGTAYQNTTGRPMVVSIQGYKSTASFGLVQVSWNGTTWFTVGNLTGTTAGQQFLLLVGDNEYYRVEGGSTIFTWTEKR